MKITVQPLPSEGGGHEVLDQNKIYNDISIFYVASHSKSFNNCVFSRC